MYVKELIDLFDSFFGFIRASRRHVPFRFAISVSSEEEVADRDTSPLFVDVVKVVVDAAAAPEAVDVAALGVFAEVVDGDNNVVLVGPPPTAIPPRLGWELPASNLTSRDCIEFATPLLSSSSSSSSVVDIVFLVTAADIVLVAGGDTLSCAETGLIVVAVVAAEGG